MSSANLTLLKKLVILFLNRKKKKKRKKIQQEESCQVGLTGSIFHKSLLIGINYITLLDSLSLAFRISRSTIFSRINVSLTDVKLPTSPCFPFGNIRPSSTFLPGSQKSPCPLHQSQTAGQHCRMTWFCSLHCSPPVPASPDSSRAELIPASLLVLPAEAQQS